MRILLPPKLTLHFSDKRYHRYPGGRLFQCRYNLSFRKEEECCSGYFLIRPLRICLSANLAVSRCFRCFSSPISLLCEWQALPKRPLRRDMPFCDTFCNNLFHVCRIVCIEWHAIRQNDYAYLTSQRVQGTPESFLSRSFLGFMEKNPLFHNGTFGYS